ncbi:MAG: Yip1 family protein, partial [Pseudolabrys sp.]
PAVCTFIGTSIIGFGAYRVGIGLGLIRAVVVYALSLAGVFVVAYIIDYLAGTFGARKSPDNAMRVSAYAPTAAWVAGVFNIIPALAFLGILGLYSLYLLHTGIAALMKPPADKAVVYTIAVIVCAIIVWVIIFGIAAMLFGL